MLTVKRTIETTINAYLHSNETKILFVWGPRRSGKTTLINKLAKELKVSKYNFDLESDREKFAPRREVLERIVKDNRVILIDEVQNYPQATVVLKLLHDEFKVKVIATGSSELRQKNSQEFELCCGIRICPRDKIMSFCQRRFYGFEVAQFSYQHYVGVLPQKVF